MTSGSSGTTDTTDSSAPTMMTLPSNSPLCCSQSELQPHSPGSLSSCSKQSNYVNIDYFIKYVVVLILYSFIMYGLYLTNL
jgi:hypothetical protein